jgi:hypothetical protein
MLNKEEKVVFLDGTPHWPRMAILLWHTPGHNRWCAAQRDALLAWKDARAEEAANTYGRVNADR